MYKNQLQELAQRSCFNLPAYACIREGPDHAPRFKATVNFNGEIFESPTFYSTLRQAEHSAAEVALNTLAKRGPSKALAARVLDETGVYKNLLQETAHRAGLNLPVYTTIRSGPGHVPTFSCTVELAGMIFAGEPAKTKKQAQKNAAMAAWSTLKQMSQQESSSSRPWGPGCHEGQEQVIVGRFLASLLPTESSNSPQNNHQIKQKRSPASTKSSLPSTPSQYCGQYQNCGSSILSPEMAMYYIWLQEQAAEQQSHVLALPVSPVPPPSHFFPLMHSIVRPSYHPYCLPQEQQTVNLRPGRGMTSTGPSLYFLNQSAPEHIRTRSMVTIQEIQEEKMEDSSQLPPPEVPKSSTLGTNGSEPVTNEQHQKFDTEKNCSPETTIGNGVIPERNQGGHLEGSSTSCLSPRIQPRDPHSTKSLGFGSPMHEHQPTHVQAAIYHGSGRMQPSNTPLINNSFSMPGPSMRTTHPSYLGRHQRPYRLPSRLMAPAVQIRSVVPVCSTPPPRKITGSRQEEQPGHEVKNRETELSPKLGNLHIKSV